MIDRHTLTHAMLAIVHAVLAVILYLEASALHAVCVALVALLYLILCWPSRGQKEVNERKEAS